jgi:hypothetical protein
MHVHWFLPTAGDSHGITSGGQAAATVATERPPEFGYLALVARTAERLGFEGVLTPTGTFCEDAWLATAALIGETSTLKFLVAFRPGLLSPTLAAQMASTYQRLSDGRLMLNIVTGGKSAEQRRFGDHLDHDQRYDHTGEFITVLRGAWSGAPFDHAGTHYRVEGATVRQPPDPVPPLFFGGSSPSGRPPAHCCNGCRPQPLPRRGNASPGRSPRASAGWPRSRAAPTSRSPPTCGRASGSCGPAPAPRSSAATRRWRNASPNTMRSASTTSSSRGSRTSRRRTASARTCCPCSVAQFTLPERRVLTRIVVASGNPRPGSVIPWPAPPSR